MSRFGSTAIQGAQQSARQGSELGQQVAQTGAEATRATEARGQATSQAQGRAQQGATQAAALKGQAGAAIGAGIADFGAAFERSIERRFQLNAKLSIMQEKANIDAASRESFAAATEFDQLHAALGILEQEKDTPSAGFGPRLTDRIGEINEDRAVLEQKFKDMLVTIKHPRNVVRGASGRLLAQLGQFRKEQETVLQRAGQRMKTIGIDSVRKAQNRKDVTFQMSSAVTSNLTTNLPRVADFYRGQDTVSDAELVTTVLGNVNPFFVTAATKIFGSTGDTMQENLSDLVNKVNRGEISVDLIAAARDSIAKALQPTGADSIHTLMRGAPEKLKRRTARALERFDVTVLLPLESNNRHTPGLEQRDMFANVIKVGMDTGVDLNDPSVDSKVMIAIGEATSIDGTTPSALLSPDPVVASAAAETVFKMTGLGPGGEGAADAIKAVAEIQKELKIRGDDTFGLPEDRIPRRSARADFLRRVELPELTASERQKGLTQGELFDFSGSTPEVIARGVRTAASTPFGVAGATFDLGTSALSAIRGGADEGPPDTRTRQEKLSDITRRANAFKLRTATARTTEGKNLLSQIAQEAFQAGLLRPATMKILGGKIDRGDLTGILLLKFIRGSGDK